MTTTRTIPKPKIKYYDANMSLMQDLTTAEEIWQRDPAVCGDCGKPAAMIGTGHRDTTLDCLHNRLIPPPWFKCAACHLKWHTAIAEILAAATVLQCRHCDRWFDTIDDFSYWRPV